MKYSIRYNITDFSYDSETEILSAEASTLHLPAGTGMPDIICIEGKTRPMEFKFDFSHRDEDNDIEYWEYDVIGHDDPTDKFYSLVVRIYND